MDLGSGGGVPGLPLALAWPASRWVLLDGSVNRGEFLRGAVSTLGLDDRIEVLAERAELAGRGPLRGALDVVVARGFGPPGPTAECAAPFLRVGGVLVVAEPPGGRPDRWDSPALGQLGLRNDRQVEGSTAYQVLVQERVCPDRYPRRVGIPVKRPLF